MAGSGKDRVPPHHEDAERAVIGAMLIDHNTLISIQQYIRSEDFYFPSHQIIYNALLDLFSRGIKPDLLTLKAELEKKQTLDKAGGHFNIASLTHAVASSANAEYYARIVQECSLRRGLIQISGEAASRAYDETLDPKLLLEETQQKLFLVSDPRRIFHYNRTDVVVNDTVTYLEAVYNKKLDYTGIPSGFESLDRWTSGFQNGELIIIGARPSMGKTAVGLNMAANMSIRQKKCVAFFSLEMSERSLMLRLISSEAEIDSYKLRKGMFTHEERKNILSASERIHEAPFYIADMSMTLGNIQAMARMLRVQQKVEIIFIDYIGLIAQDHSHLKRYEFISDVSRALKGLARDLDIPIVALSQLRREAEKERPNLSDIRESGSIEQDADMVILLNRDRELGKTLEEQEKEPITEVQLILAKNRNGPVGTVKLTFNKPFTKFLPRDSSQD